MFRNNVSEYNTLISLNLCFQFRIFLLEYHPRTSWSPRILFPPGNFWKQRSIVLLIFPFVDKILSATLFIFEFLIFILKYLKSTFNSLLIFISIIKSRISPRQLFTRWYFWNLRYTVRSPSLGLIHGWNYKTFLLLFITL